jgi:hypothetical protein
MQMKLRTSKVLRCLFLTGVMASVSLGAPQMAHAKKAKATSQSQTAAHKGHQIRPAPMTTPETLEQLDSAGNLLMTISDADKPGVCGISPSEARRYLLALHPIFDEKKNAAVSALSVRPAGKAIANPKWDQTCLRKCHCGLYSSILEGVGEQRLVPADRDMLNSMSSKARVMTREHLEVCARTSQWFCKSGLLARLKEDAKNYPDPLATNPVPAPVSPKKKGETPVSPSVRHY